MLDVFHIAQPQGCNIQMFYGSSNINNDPSAYRGWNKPRGVSHVYMLLIGAGGKATDGSTGGGSGAVTVWYGAAQNVPDFLIVKVSTLYDTEILSKLTDVRQLLIGRAGSSSTGGTAMTANQFCASGFFQSIAGDTGSSGGIGASTTTFLSGGGIAAGVGIANYGYSTPTGSDRSGFFMLSPIIVGLGGSGTGTGGIGCGSGNVTGALPGPGFALIASW